MSPFFIFAASIFLILFLSIAIRKMTERAFPPRLLLILFFPGAALHEIFHAIASLLVGAKVHGINFFSLSGGSVLHEKPRLPFGQILISFAPFIGGIVLIIFLSSTMFFNKVRPVPDILTINPIGIIVRLKESVLVGVSTFWFWVWLYILYSVSATMLPSRQDVKNSFVSLVVIGTALFFFFRSGLFAFDLPILIQWNNVLVSVVSVLVVLVGISWLARIVRVWYNKLTEF